MSSEENNLEPYAPLFPVAIVVGCVGVLLWLLFQFRGLSYYPKEAHANIMFFGFLWAFIAGFLMTAVPKMLGVQWARVWEYSLPAFFVFLQVMLNVRNLQQASVILLLVQNLYLLTFLVQRFWQKKAVPFAGFVFLPLAFAQSILGSVLFLSGKGSQFLYLLSGEAFVLSLVVGIGSRLIPVLCRLENTIAPDQRSQANSHLQNFPMYLLIAIIFNLSYEIELFLHANLGLALRLLVFSFVAWRFFRIFERPTAPTRLGWGIRLATGFIFLSFVLKLSSFAMPIPAQHLLYIGGLTLLTLMVATRVMVAHSGRSLNYELSSRRVVIVMGLLFAAAGLRYFSGVQVTGPALTLALLLFITALGLWGWRFLQFTFATKKDQSSC